MELLEETSWSLRDMYSLAVQRASHVRTNPLYMFPNVFRPWVQSVFRVLHLLKAIPEHIIVLEEKVGDNITKHYQTLQTVLVACYTIPMPRFAELFYLPLIIPLSSVVTGKYPSSYNVKWYLPLVASDLAIE